MCTNSQTLYTEGLVRLRRRQILSGLYEIIFRIAALSAVFALRAAILHESQNYLEGGGGGGGLGGCEKNRETVITSLQLAFRRPDRNLTPLTIH